jgi:hypothetical protein
MRKFIFVTLFAIVLISIFFVGNRDDAINPEELAPVQQRQNLTLPQVSRQPEDVLASYTESDNRVSNEEMIVINWYAPQHHTLVHPQGTPLENYNYYKLASEAGFGLASYQLAIMMERCRQAFLTREDLEKAILEMNSTSTLVVPYAVRSLPVTNPGTWVKGAVNDFEYCEGFTADQRDDSAMWLELAANQGLTKAMIHYGWKLHYQGPQAQVQLFESAWRLGDADALQWLAQGLFQIYDQGIDPTAKVPAYAAMHAYVTLLRSAPERLGESWISSAQARLDEMAINLMPSEIEAAVGQSRELINENGNCCFSNYFGLGNGS